MTGQGAQERTRPGQTRDHLPTTPRPAHVRTGVLSWWSWTRPTVAVIICVRLTTAAARTSISSVSERTEDMSAVKIAVENLEMNNMPVTALMTVWPKETAAPTTSRYAEVTPLGCRTTVRRSRVLNAQLDLCALRSLCCQWMDSERHT